MCTKTIYIAGHTGLVGSAALRLFGASEKHQVMTAAHSELELQDSAAVQHFFGSNPPDDVILAAGKAGGTLENKTYPADFINANLNIQLNVLAAAHRMGCNPAGRRAAQAVG